jgi:glycosyltransferase involved in cell wall biosynthesis
MIHLFLDASAASSGSGPTYVRNVVPHLAARADVRATILITPQLHSEFADRSNVTFIELAKSGGVIARFLRTQKALPRLIMQSGADVLISAGNIALFRSPVPQILLSGNALYTSQEFYRDVLRRRHYGLWLDTKLKGILARQSVRVANRTIAPSAAYAAEIERWTGVKAIAIHHGFDRDLFFRDVEPLPEALEAKLKRDDDEFRLLFVSHYNYYRNFDTLIRALPLIQRQLPSRKVRLFLTTRLQPGMNPGTYRTNEATALVQSLGLGPSIVELDAVPYHLLHDVYRACDLYVTPAYVETFAHPLVEAMASGLPVVASDLAVHREVCGEAALFFETFSRESLSVQVVRVASDQAVARELSERGVIRSNDFSWQDHVRQVLAVASSLTGSSDQRRAT